MNTQAHALILQARSIAINAAAVIALSLAAFGASAQPKSVPAAQPGAQTSPQAGATQASAANTLSATGDQVTAGNEAVCKSETQKYQETLKFLKAAAGEKITDMVKSGLLDEKQVAD